jgi:hypothetical protein
MQALFFIGACRNISVFWPLLARSRQHRGNNFQFLVFIASFAAPMRWGPSRAAQAIEPGRAHTQFDAAPDLVSAAILLEHRTLR